MSLSRYTKNFLFSFALCVQLGCNSNPVSSLSEWTPRDGDIIYHTSSSSQSLPIRIATDSEYSHEGVIFNKNGQPHVLEASSTVMYTRLIDFIDRGKSNDYTVQRYKGSPQLTAQRIISMRSFAESQLGKGYDRMFGWSDDLMYCSEIVWKTFDAGGIRISGTKKFREFNFDNPIVRRTVEERWGDSINWNEEAVSPAGLSRSENLETVYSTY